MGKIIIGVDPAKPGSEGTAIMLPWYATPKELADAKVAFPNAQVFIAPEPEPASEADAANHFPGIS